MQFEKVSYTDVLQGFHEWLNNIYQPFVYDNDTKELEAADILWALDRDTYEVNFDIYCKEKHLMRCTIRDSGGFSVTDADADYYRPIYVKSTSLPGIRFGFI